MFGAADPSSGTATMVEVARGLGWLKSKGKGLGNHFLLRERMTIRDHLLPSNLILAYIVDSFVSRWKLSFCIVNNPVNCQIMSIFGS